MKTSSLWIVELITLAICIWIGFTLFTISNPAQGLFVFLSAMGIGMIVVYIADYLCLVDKRKKHYYQSKMEKLAKWINEQEEKAGTNEYFIYTPELLEKMKSL